MTTTTTTNDLVHAMRTNAAARTLPPEPVDDTVVRRILDHARFAPSGGNKQGWHVVVAKDPSLRRQLAELCQTGWREYSAIQRAGFRPFAAGVDGKWHGTPPSVDLTQARATAAPWSFLDQIAQVPVMLVVGVDMTQLAAIDADLDRMNLVAGGSIYPFVQNILLAARTEGLAGVMTTFIVREEPAVKKLLRFPPEVAVAALLCLGVPPTQPSKLRRRSVDQFTTVDSFDGPSLI